MAKFKKWTAEEDNILVQAIIANPYNKAQVFRAIANQLNRTVKATEFRWYGVLSNPENKHYVGCLYTLVGIHSRLDNRTVYKDNYTMLPKQHSKSIWTKIKKLLSL